MKKTFIQLPADEGPHNQSVEWWYWVARLNDKNSHDYATMFTLFKVRLFGNKNAFFSHWFVSNINTQTFDPHFHVFWKGLDKESFKRPKLFARAKDVMLMEKMKDDNYRIRTNGLDLTMRPVKPPLLIDGTGDVDLKTTRTFYYSLPRLECKGKININEKDFGVSGLAWMDHQWSPITFDREHVWKWFCFQLADGTDLQCFDYGKSRHARLATISKADGEVRVFKKVDFKQTGEYWTSSKSGAAYPVSWKINIPEGKMTLECKPAIKNQELLHGPFRYWEGPINVQAIINGKRIWGKGFMELNGIPSGKTLFQMIREQFK